MKSKARWYSSQGVERKKLTGEVFTPEIMGDEMLDLVLARDPMLIRGNYLDPSCGDGNLLLCVLKRKIKSGIHPHHALESLYGIELMEDNVVLCRQRLAEHAARTLYKDDGDYEVILNICLEIVNSSQDSSYPRIVCHDTLSWSVEHWQPMLASDWLK
jgi:hypothetical protein